MSAIYNVLRVECMYARDTEIYGYARSDPQPLCLLDIQKEGKEGKKLDVAAATEHIRDADRSI